MWRIGHFESPVVPDENIDCIRDHLRLSSLHAKSDCFPPLMVTNMTKFVNYRHIHGIAARSPKYMSN